jgi:hypothetical protein
MALAEESVKPPEKTTGVTTGLVDRDRFRLKRSRSTIVCFKLDFSEKWYPFYQISL